ncbi:metK, partial [Symbiodinium necroappetens]
MEGRDVRVGNFQFTSESVSEGHPDKVCDRISDAIVDTFLTHDPLSRVAVETLTTTNRIVLAGEVRGSELVTQELLEEVARYAVRDIGYTEDLMPAPIHFSHNILKSLAEARHSGAEPGLAPDAKSQVTLAYEDGKPVRATSVVVSTQHHADLTQEEVREIVRPHVVNVLPQGWMCPEEEFYVNPTGRF